MFLFKLVKAYVNIAAARGITKFGRRRLRNEALTELSTKLHTRSFSTDVFSAIQDLLFPMELCEAEKIIVILAPEKNEINGGIFSLFSIANQMRKLKRIHGHDVVVMTLPSKTDETYFRNTFFINSENIYRISQISLCRNAKEIHLHIPEYAIEKFLSFLPPNDLSYLKSVGSVYINILNQNVKKMPTKEALTPLSEIADEVTQSVAHHAYFNQDVADAYGLPTLLLPAYTDLSAYAAATFTEKEKLIIYSPDDADHKQQCLEAIAKRMPDFKLIEIRGITFDKYMDLATRCMFSITFGEGFDGYLAQPIHQGGIGFSVYNEDFFPTSNFLSYENIFSSNEQMVDKICARMLNLSQNENQYSQLNKALLKEYQRLYSFEDYVKQIKKLSLRQFEYFPRPEATKTLMH